MKKWTALLLAMIMALSCGLLSAFAEAETPEAAYEAFSAEAEKLKLPDDLEAAKDLITRIQACADANRSALKDAKKGIDEITFKLYKLGGDLSVQIVDLLTDEEKAANNNPYGLCCNYVADCYKGGTGVEKDEALAIEWYGYALYTFQCSRSAMSLADYLFSSGKYEEAYQAYLYGRENFSHMKAARALGKYYELGYGGLFEKDNAKAEEYYKLGAGAGDGTSYARWANLYARQLMGKGKPAVFRAAAYDILAKGIPAALKLENIEDQEAIKAAVEGAKDVAAVDDMLFLMGYVVEMGYENQDGSVKVDADPEGALFWYSILSGASHEFGYDFDAAVERVQGKISGSWVEWNKDWGGVDKMLDTALIEEREAAAAAFQTLEYTYADGSFK